MSLVFRQYDLACLSQLSYLIGDSTTGRAVVIDPRRDVDVYLNDARRNGLQIDRVIETHIHADFVSGQLELAAATGAVISYGSAVETELDVDRLAHGQRLDLGEVSLEIRHTPGHTPESICVVVHRGGDDGRPWGVLTGDTLFLGDVGRPDLLTSRGATAESLASLLFASLRDQVLSLPDATQVFPGHGAGSACGRSLAAGSQSTIHAERAANPLLSLDAAGFVSQVTEALAPPPPYFASAAAANRLPHRVLDDAPVPALDVDEILRQQALGAVIVDTRHPDRFTAGHLPGALNVGLDGRFAEGCGAVVAAGERIALVVDAERSGEARTRLARIGFDEVVGALVDVESALDRWPHVRWRATRVDSCEVATWQDEGAQVIDVRSHAECDDGIIPGAIVVPLPELRRRLPELDPSMASVVCCASGYRSSVASSLLRREGFFSVVDVAGGYLAWSSATSIEGGCAGPAEATRS